MQRTGIVIAFCGVLLGLCGETAWAQHKRRDRDVLIDNKKKILTIHRSPVVGTAAHPGRSEDGDIANLRSAQTAIIRPNEVMQVGIDRQNPLIFVYTWKGLVLTPTPDYTAAAAFAASLKQFVSVAPFKALENATARSVKVAPSTATRTIIESRLSKVQEIAKTVGFTDDTVAQIATLRNNLVQQVNDIPKLRKETLDDATVGSAKGEVVNWKTAEQKKSTDTLFATLSNARNALLRALEEEPNLFESDPAFVATINMVSDEEANVRRLLVVVTQFAEGMAAVDTRLPLGEAIAFDAANTVTATVTISYATGAQDLVNEQFPVPAQRPMMGDFSITFEPYSSWAIGGGPSILYVFRKNDEGKNIGWRPAGMLTLTKRSWLDGLAAPRVEFGVTPETDKMGLYVGLGFRVRGVFQLSGGVSVQQFKKQEASDWRPSGYLGVTVDLVPKK